MEDLRGAALAYYANLSDDDKKLAKDFFKSMDANNDGEISLGEYSKFLSKKIGCVEINRPEFFKELDRDGNDSLDFEEAITLYYISATDRLAFCAECRVFLKGVYFTCFQCFSSSTTACNRYDLCSACYGGKKFEHHDDAIFCDNFALLLKSRSLVATAPPKGKARILRAIRAALHVASIAGTIASCSIM